MYFEKLTETDKDLIKNYIQEYSRAGEEAQPMATLEKILEPWDKAKSGYLSTLFKDNLIVKKPIEFQEDLYEIEEKMDMNIWQDSRCANFLLEIREFYYTKFGHNNWDTQEYQSYSFINAITDIFALSKNKIDMPAYFRTSDTFNLMLKDEIYKVSKGMKVIRIISKVATSWNIGLSPDNNGVSDLEYFRRRHSQALNTKTLKGDLCLSIHPLDYMTMSDNNCGWDSCMSWENDGEYKQGTVEMMNSPCVVVGYLASDRPFSWGYGTEWNNKKWRCLFIVDPHFIINIKSYPYENTNLVKTAISEISKMAGWGGQNPTLYEYFENQQQYRDRQNPTIINNRKIAIDFRTQAMYNDFNSGHYIALNPNETHDIIDYEYMYSGVSECVWCGNSNIYIESYNLVCDDCADFTGVCEECNERIYESEYYTTAEGCVVCSYCWNDETVEDSLDGGWYLNRNTMRIYLSRKNEKFTFMEDPLAITVYRENINSDLWNRCFKINELRVFDSSISWLAPTDCTPLGLAAFGIESEEELNEYMNSKKTN